MKFYMESAGEHWFPYSMSSKSTFHKIPPVYNTASELCNNFITVHMAVIPGQQGRNSRSVRAIIGGQIAA